MLAILPLLALVIAVALMRRLGWDLRGAILSGAAVWGAALVAITEALSTVKGLRVGGVALAWAVVTAVGALALRRLPRSRSQAVETGLADSAASRWLLGGLALVAAGVLVTGLASAPNNWDSMTYHLTRVEHWVQNATVTSIPRRALGRTTTTHSRNG